MLLYISPRPSVFYHTAHFALVLDVGMDRVKKLVLGVVDWAAQRARNMLVYLRDGSA